MNIKLIDQENPSCFWVSFNGFVDVFTEIFFCTGCPNRRSNYLPLGKLSAVLFTPLPASRISFALVTRL
jgi:hypothetical protein